MIQRVATAGRVATVGDVAAVIAGALVTALAAQVSIPYQPVPQTLQTMAVLGVGCALGARRGAAAMLLYLALGAGGLPVFAAGSTGLSGPTAGYLWGFVLAAFIAGWLTERLGTSLYATVPAMVVASVPIYALGLLWLDRELGGIGLARAADLGLEPFVVADALKILAAAALLDPRAPWGGWARSVLAPLR